MTLPLMVDAGGVGSCDGRENGGGRREGGRSRRRDGGGLGDVRGCWHGHG
jgi:hypothetical protein